MPEWPAADAGVLCLPSACCPRSASTSSRSRQTPCRGRPGGCATLGRDGAPHVRPVFAAWTGSSFVVASKHGAAKSRNLRADGRCTITTDIGSLHVVVEGHARRVTDPERLQLASRAMQEVFNWPTEVVGEELDADYGAPTSGEPPYEVYEMHPQRAFGFPTQDDFDPTRWRFPEQTDPPRP